MSRRPGIGADWIRFQSLIGSLKTIEYFESLGLFERCFNPL